MIVPLIPASPKISQLRLAIHLQDQIDHALTTIVVSPIAEKKSLEWYGRAKDSKQSGSHIFIELCDTQYLVSSQNKTSQPLFTMSSPIETALPEGYRSPLETPIIDEFSPNLSEQYKDNRLGMRSDLRIYTIGGFTFLAGTILGTFQEYNRAALRFRAENAHRLPRSERNWFFYHRAKSLDALKSAMPFGIKTGFKMAPWAMGFLVMEEGVDHARGGTSRDFVSDVVAGISIAGVASLWFRQGVPEAGRMVKTGAKVGLVYGLFSDGISYLSGQRLFYVDYARRAFGFGTPENETNDAHSSLPS